MDKWGLGFFMFKNPEIMHSPWVYYTADSNSMMIAATTNYFSQYNYWGVKLFNLTCKFPLLIIYTTISYIPIVVQNVNELKEKLCVNESWCKLSLLPTAVNFNMIVAYAKISALPKMCNCWNEQCLWYLHSYIL